MSIKESSTQLRGTWNATVGFEYTMNYPIAILDHKYSMDRVENHPNAKVGYENTTRNIVVNPRRGALDSDGMLSTICRRPEMRLTMQQVGLHEQNPVSLRVEDSETSVVRECHTKNKESIFYCHNSGHNKHKFTHRNFDPW